MTRPGPGPVPDRSPGRLGAHHPPNGGGHHHDPDPDPDPDQQVGGRHRHGSGARGWLRHLLVPHSHDAAKSFDDVVQSSAAGIRAVKLSLVALLVTALAQSAVVLVSGSVALLADTVHNFSDALTAVPLWVAFVLGRRPASRRYTYGLGRAEDMAGLFIVVMIAMSAVLAGVESVRRLVDPPSLAHLGWVLIAGLIGFLGNELVAAYRIRIGRRIGSAALVADGVHARTDGFTSLAVVLGVVGTWAGLPWADPVVGVFISLLILVLLVATARTVGRRLLDGVDPGLVDQIEDVLGTVPGVLGLRETRLRWLGHRLSVHAVVECPSTMTVSEFQTLSTDATLQIRSQVPGVGSVRLSPAARASDAESRRRSASVGPVR